MKGWRVRHLIGAWTTYWAGLALVTIGPIAFRVWQMGQTNAKGDLSVSTDGGVLKVIGHDGSAIMVNASISLIAAALWISVPPLVIWAIWMISRPVRSRIASDADSTDDVAMLTSDPSGTLGAPPDGRSHAAPREQAPEHRGRDNN